MSILAWWRGASSAARSGGFGASRTSAIGGGGAASRPSPAAPTTIEGIQVLRAIAALMVVYHHALHSVAHGPAWPGFGAAGVDIFFVISGFVMAHTTRNLHRQGVPAGAGAQAADFLLKRFIRVVPLYWIALLWTARRDIAAGQVDGGLVKDFLFIPHASTLYPDMLWPSVVQGWTLNYEMFFYALFALALLFGRARHAVLIGALLVLAIVGAALPAHVGAVAHSAELWENLARFYTHDILLEFAFGVLLQRAVAGGVKRAWPRLAYVGLLLAGFVLLALGHDHGPRSLTQGLPALLIVWSAIHAWAGLSLRGWENLANASYSIYLFHWASFGAVKPVAAWLAAGPLSQAPAGVSTALLLALHLVVAALSGIAIHHVLEKPLLRHAQAWLLRRPAPVGAA